MVRRIAITDGFLQVQRCGSNWLVNGDRRHAIEQDPCDGPGGCAHNLRAGWAWTGSSLRAWTDPTGFVPVFYSCAPDEFIISTSLAEIVSCRPDATLDSDALSVFLRLGYFLGEDTAFANVRALPPGADLEWSAEGLRLTGGIEHPRPLEIGRAEAVVRYAELFRAAVRRRPPGSSRVALPLSAGRDSRHIAYELHAAGWTPSAALTVCKNWPPERDGQGSLAGLVARRLGIAHRFVRVTDGLEAEARKNELTHFLTDEHAWLLGLRDALAAGYDRIYDGLAGDILSNGLGFTPDRLSLFRRGDLAGLADNLLGTRDLPYLDRRMARDLGYERAQARMIAELRRHADAPNPVSSFLFWNRTRREIALSPLCLLGQGMNVQLPYMDVEVLAFLRRLPAEGFGAPGLHDETIAHAFPAFSDLPLERKQPAAERRAHGQAVRATLEAAMSLLVRRGGKGLDWPWSLARMATAVATGRPQQSLWWAASALYCQQLGTLIRRGASGRAQPARRDSHSRSEDYSDLREAPVTGKGK